MLSGVQSSTSAERGGAALRSGDPDRLEQLAVAHPLLAFALKTGYGCEADRQEAMTLVRKGRALKDVCAVMDIPYALRRIAPDALGEALTEAKLSERAGQVMAARVLRSPSLAARIVQTGFYATRLGGSDYGLWQGKTEHVAALPGIGLEVIRPVALYAWYSSRPEQVLSALAPHPWSATMGWRAALVNTSVWLNRLKFFLYFKGRPITDHWAEAATVDGFEMVPLVSFELLMSEIEDMDNCLIGYADQLFSNRCRLFGVRRDGAKIGTVELCAGPTGVLQQAQYCGPRNTGVPFESRVAVERWISAQRPLAAERRAPSNDFDCQRWVEEAFAAHARDRDLGPGFWQQPLTLARLSQELCWLLRPPRPARVIVQQVRR